jgi:hypothetical protein
MLSDETPRFSAPDVYKLGSLIVIGTLAYANLAQQQARADERVNMLMTKDDKQDEQIANLTNIASANAVSIQNMVAETERTRDRVRSLEGGRPIGAMKGVE